MAPPCKVMAVLLSPSLQAALQMEFSPRPEPLQDEGQKSASAEGTDSQGVAVP